MPRYSRHPLANPLYHLFSLFLLEWQAFVGILLQLLPYLTQSRHQGIYEILEYDSTLELLDSHGHQAIFRKRQKVRFLQDHIIAFQDYAWGDGDIFAEYRISPGTAVDRYQEGDRWNILVSLRSTKTKDDIEEFHIERKVRNGFTTGDEWHQVEIRHATKQLRIAVIFPKDRPCRTALLQERSRNRSIELDNNSYVKLVDGRQMIQWQSSRIRHLEIYTLRWQW